jgi:hypothetical protein
MLGPFVCACFRFVLQATTPLRLGAFVGATLRGGFGVLFKRIVCVWPPGACDRCLLANACSYRYVFETAPPPHSTRLRGLDQIPRPYIIEPPVVPLGRTFLPDDKFNFRLVLVGRGIEYLPFFLYTFRRLGQTGLGLGRGQFLVVEIYAEGNSTSRCVYSHVESVLRADVERIEGDTLTTAAPLLAGTCGAQRPRLAIHFLTPTRIHSDGVLSRAPSFQDLIRALLRRLSSLCYFHCGGGLALDFKRLIVQAGAVRTVESRLHWRRQERYSRRQQQKIEMGGVLGTMVFEATDSEQLASFLPLVAAGEWVHVGKGCVMGLGQYRVEVPA